MIFSSGKASREISSLLVIFCEIFLVPGLKMMIEPFKPLRSLITPQDSAVYKTLAYYKSCMNQNSIKNVGIKSILEQIEQHGSWNITNKDWTGDSWKLEKILARVLVDLNTPAFLSWSIGADFFDTSKSYITVNMLTFLC